MVFSPPPWVSPLPFDPPDSVTIAEFWGEEEYGRHPFNTSRAPFICAITGKSWSNAELKQRYEALARSLSKRLGWRPNHETAWDKVMAIFAFNSAVKIDYIMATFAVHRLSGIATPANAMYSASELEFQLRSSGAKALITCVPLLETALRAARGAGIPEHNVLVMDVALGPRTSRFDSLDDLIVQAASLPALEQLQWTKGQGARQVAYLCYSSGTSGLPKAVKIAHRNVIANVMQIRSFESVGRGAKGVRTQTQLGLLPLSHIYGLVVVAHAGMYRGDSIILLPRFHLATLLESIDKFKINVLYLVPPIIIDLLKKRETCSKYDISSVRLVYTGAAPLGPETHEHFLESFPSWNIVQGYGLTETSTVVTSTSEHDVLVGSSGSLLPSVRAKMVGEDGKEITGYDVPGELYIQSPSVTLGYLNDNKATDDAFVHDEAGRWMRTGDVAVVRKSASGFDHFAIVDRIKELIKVKGNQVAPAELEAHLLTHPAVDDCAVIPVPDREAGELPKAYIVRSAAAAARPADEVAGEIRRHVEEHKARYKWLRGGLDFIDTIPKSPSGKILRRRLRHREREARKASAPKL